MRPAAGAAQQRIDARQKLLDVERLDHVVVGPELEDLDFVLPTVARRQHEDRVFLAFGAQLLDQLDARHARQAEIDDREIDGVFARVIETLAAVGRLLHGVAGLLELRGERTAQVGVVFDEQQPHVGRVLEK